MATKKLSATSIPIYKCFGSMPARSPGERGRADTRHLSWLGCPASEALAAAGRQLIYAKPHRQATTSRPPEDSVMIDHLAIQCADVAASAAFYDAVLAPMGGRRVMDFGDVIGFGVPPRPDFWIGPLTTGEGFRESHIAFTAPDRAAVRAFFQTAVDAGAEVLYEPRLWPEYHPSYYGAFVRDPDGNNVEAVCHAGQ